MTVVAGRGVERGSSGRRRPFVRRGILINNFHPVPVTSSSTISILGRISLPA